MKKTILVMTMRFLLCMSFFLLFYAAMSAQTTEWFSNATKQVHLDSIRGFRINIVDFNNDDYPDLLLENGLSNRDRLTRLFANRQDPNSTNPHDRVFVDITAASGIFAHPDLGPDSSRVIDIATMADINNDGNMDLVTGTYYDRLEVFADSMDRCEVMLGDGKGHFTLVPSNGLHELGLINTGGFTFIDYDLDGKLDLYIATWFKDKTNNEFMTDFLMKGNGDGTFTNVTQTAGIDKVAFPMYGASATDWNNDGLPDILTSAYCRSGGSLWYNNGDGSFTDIAEGVGYSSQLMTGDVDDLGARALCQWAALPGDFDNDGDMDIMQILVHGGLDAGEGRSVLSINQGPEKGYALQWDLNRITRDNPKSFHLGDQDGAWFDMDNDGWLDLAIAQCVYLPETDRTYILHQNNKHTFDDVSQETGLLYLKQTHNNRPFDYDLDGDDDLLVELWKPNDFVSLVKNEIGNKNNSVSVKLIAPTGVNRNAIGARITLYAGGMAQIREVQAGQGHFGAQQPLIRVFGLGKNDVIDSIVVRWPGKNRPNTVAVNPPVNTFLTIDGQGVVNVNTPGSAARTDVLSLYPNPVTERVTIQIPEACRRTGVIEIFNVMGQRMTAMEVNGQSALLMPTADWASGWYLIRLHAGEKIMTTTFIRR